MTHENKFFEYARPSLSKLNMLRGYIDVQLHSVHYVFKGHQITPVFWTLLRMCFEPKVAN